MSVAASTVRSLASAVCVLLAWASCAHAAEARRIVSLAPHLSELVFAAGAGEALVGAVEYSDYPQAAQRVPRIGDAHRIDLERVLALRPDLVLAWESGTPTALIDQLRRLGLAVELVTTRRLGDIPRALQQIGAAAGAASTAEATAQAFEARIQALREQYARRPAVSVFVQVNAQPLYTVNGRHIISEVLALCGGRNVFGALNDLAPSVGVEAVLAADPQAILVSDAIPDASSQWRRWPQLQAVSSAAVFVVSSDHLTRATTRMAQGAEQVCGMLQRVRERKASQ